MWCCKCQKELSECTCADLQERLRSAASALGGNFVYRYCRKCGKHYAKCDCPDPIWAIKKDADG